ncbi:MAG: PilZ domain-containing protein [Acidobacteriota bacterium]|nr:MAG: PilZ domain-containing protein [Acidobacteriota bacterium]
MGQLAYREVTEALPLHKRIQARLQAQVSWVDEDSNERVSILGHTENVGESNALVNINVLPKVGSSVKLRLFDEDKHIIEIPATVIRVERDPSKPQAALAIVKNIKKWKNKVLAAAQDWVSRDLRLNYEGDDWLN